MIQAEQDFRRVKFGPSLGKARLASHVIDVKLEVATRHDRQHLQEQGRRWGRAINR